MQDDAIRTARIHLAFILVTGLKCSYGKISRPLTEIPVGKTKISETEPTRPFIYEDIKNFTKYLEVKTHGQHASDLTRFRSETQYKCSHISTF